MKITSKLLKKLIREQYIDDSEQEFVGPPVEEPEEPFFTEPAGEPLHTPEVDGRPVHTPQEDGHVPMAGPDGPVFKAEVYSNPKYKEYFKIMSRAKKRLQVPPPKLPRTPGLDDLRDDPRSPEYIPGYERSRPGLAESKKGEF